MSCVSAADFDSDAGEIIADSASAEISEIHVAPNGSDEGDGSLQNPFKSIKYAVANGNNDSAIYLDDGEYAGADNRNIKIDKSVSIIGKSKQSTVINGESSARLFDVTSTGRLTLVNVTLLKGYSAGNGGSIYCEGGAVSLKDCIVMNSRSDKDGGVIYNNLGVLNIEDTCFTNNSASDYAGVLYTLGKTTIKNTNFTKNVLTAKWGVGACIATGGTIDLDGCLFADCYTQYAAAGILNIGNATVNNCRFERMTTNYTAGGISNHQNLLINNSYFGYNDVQYYAAAILAPPSGQHVTTEVYNTIFEKNHAGYHGAVSNNFKDTDLYMKNCAIVDNYLKLNEIYGDFALDEGITVQYCWWGKNTINPYFYSPHSGEKHPEYVNASRWLIMTFTAQDDGVYKNENNLLTVSLKQYYDNDTKEIYPYEEEFNLPLDVTFYTDSGTLAVKKLINGTATFEYNPKNEDAVYAKIDNQVLKIEDFKLRKTDILCMDFEKYYGSDSKLSVKLVDENGVALSNKNLAVNLNGKSYSVKTDKNGIAKVSVKNTPNKYSVKVSFDETGYIGSSKTVKVKIVKPTITASKVKVRKKGNFVVTFKDANKKAIKNVKVQFKIKGKTYVRTTDSKGQAKLTMNLKVGKYTVKVGFKSTSKYGTTTLTKKVNVIK